VPVGNPVLAPPTQPWQPLDQALSVPDLDVVGVEAGLHPLPDQPAGHRVGVAADVDGAPGIHPDLDALAGVEALPRQRSQQRQLLDQSRPPALVPLHEQLLQERLVSRTADKIAAAAQQEGLVQCPLELSVALLHVAVLVRLRRIDRLALQAVVPQQRLVTPLKGRAIATGWDRSR
jgi:hypothetical protein